MSVAVAARRRLAGASSQARSSSSSMLRRPSSSGAVAGAQQLEVQRAQAGERGEVPAQGAGVGGDEDAALGEHRVAREADRARHEREVVGGVPGGRDDAQRPERVAVAQPEVGARPAGGGDRRSARALTHRGRRVGVVGVVVGERDPGRATAADGLLEDVVDVVVERRSGVHDPARITADDPRVRAGERERSRVVGVHERHVEALKRRHLPQSYAAGTRVSPR
jgi:hypothetical protein